jgi:pimeloyl-ACP methyl ester carboxylesterase
MAERLRTANPRLDAPKARFLAEHLSRPAQDGFAWRFDPLHRAPFATLHRAAEWVACLRRIAAPVLWVASGAVFPPALEKEPGGFEARLRLLPHASFERIEGTGHNLHHDAPAAVAALVEGFLAAEPGGRSA